MIYSIEGTITHKGETFVVLEAGGIGFKVSVNDRTLHDLPSAGEEAKLFCHLQVRDDAMELYGFLTESELKFFELLISVSGVGPRSALSILQVADLKQLAAAIKEGRADALTRASGIGRKTAERIIVELRSKIQIEGSGEMVKRMESDADIVEMLGTLGYSRNEAKRALATIPDTILTVEERLRAALKILGKTRGGA